ncbi:hypothetical protein ACQEVI_02290 [Promicromonospora sp. CA-289599]|uniref:hypothetical protein n=1 Tax=Promicromonospora sp. CA-289599 TaxID=3240014 RepID=UPI003D8A621F
MTTIDTRPAPRTSSQGSRHEHSWATESRHATSAGHVVYVRCTACGSHRVDLQGHREMPPAPLTRVVGSAS